MRTLGLDVGDRRIGVALSDETATLASGLESVVRVGPVKDVKAVAALVRGHAVAEVVVGLPRNMDGSLGPQAQKVLAFMEDLKKAVRVPVVPWDERLTTVMAHRTLDEAEMGRRRRKGVVDKVAAILILQSYLDYRKLAESEAGKPTP